MYRYLLIAFAWFGLVYMSGSLTFLLTPAGSDASPMWQQLGILIGAFAALDLARLVAGDGVRWREYSAIGLILAYATLTILWSVDPELATRRVGALILTAIFGIWLAERFRPGALLNLVAAALLATCLASYVAVFVFPDFGVHQAANIVNEASVGAWRGMYNHKNDFGRMAALSVIVFAVLALNRRRHRGLYLAGAASAFVLVVGSVSSQAILLSILGTATAMLAMLLRWRTAAERAMALVFLVPFGVVAIALANYAATEVLSAMGKDFTFSDRTNIWAVVTNGVRNHILLGGGYGVGWQMVSEAINQRFGRSIGHAHNGYLMMVVNVGLLGAAMTTLVFLYTGVIAFLQLMRGRQVEFACFWLCYQIYFLTGNMAASFALEYNTLDFVLMSIAAATLRRTERSGQGRRISPYQVKSTKTKERFPDIPEAQLVNQA